MTTDELTFHFEPIPPIPVLAKLWGSVFDESDASFFLSPTWISSWLELSSSSPYLFSALQNGVEVAVAILNCNTRGVQPLGGETFYLNSTGDESEDRIFIEYNDILFRRNASPCLRRTVIDGLLQSLQTHRNRAGSFSVNIPRSALDSQGYKSNFGKVQTQLSDAVNYVDLEKARTKQGYLSLLSRNTRYQIRRSERLYQEQYGSTLSFESADTAETAIAWLDHLAALQIERWQSAKITSSFEDPFFRAFVAELCRKGIPRGEVDLLRFRVDETIIGYVLSFLSRNEVLNYQAAFTTRDPDNRFKPGLLCHSKAIDHYTEKNFSTYNFLSGDAQYKKSLSTNTEKIFDVQIKGSSRDFPTPGGLNAGAVQTASRQLPAPLRSALVLGDDTRSFLTCVRSLGRHAVHVDVAPANMRSPALKSIYVRSVYSLPAYRSGEDHWINAALALIRQNEYDVIIPCDDRTILLFDKYRDRFEGLTKLAIPNPQSIRVFYNKEETRRLARSLGVPVAKGMNLSSTPDAPAIADHLGLPLALKPKHSYSLDNLHSRNEVAIIRDLDQLEHHLSDIDKKADYFAEAFFQGIGIGLSVLASNGQIMQSFQHNRINEPGDSGGSSLRKSAPINRSLEGAVASMVAATNYSGLAMFEFRLNEKTAEWILLEVNARLWGSVPLPVGLGIDFPWRAASLLVSPETGQRRLYYKTGKKARNALNDWYDVVSTFENVSTPLLHKARRLLDWVSHFFLVSTGLEISDTIARDDIKPGLFEFYLLIRDKVTHILNQILAKVPFHASLSRASVARKLLQSGSGRDTIVFLCYGNICRSPFAAEYLAQVLKNKGLEIRVASSGCLQKEHRSSPSPAIEAGLPFGVDLSNHHSTSFEGEITSRTAILFIFDRANHDWVASNYPELLPRTFYLGHMRVAPGRRAEIFDPYDHPADFFHQQFDDIKKTLDVVVDDLAKVKSVDA